MDAHFILVLDTTAPSNISIEIASPTNSQTVMATLSATDATQMKIYGDILSDTSSTNTITEETASWINYETNVLLLLSPGDEAKTVYAKFRDDVGNETPAVSTVVSLDTSAPAVVISSGPDYATISEIDGFDTCTFSWSADEPFVEYKVCVVPSNTSPHNVGSIIGMESGSMNMAGLGSFEERSTITSAIKGSDLRDASPGDGAKIIKVFVKDSAGNWSI